jgi:hypothetical protein
MTSLEDAARERMQYALCRHCPKRIHRHLVSGLWVDDRGIEVCVRGSSGAPPVLHLPMPVIGKGTTT